MRFGQIFAGLWRIAYNCAMSEPNAADHAPAVSSGDGHTTGDGTPAQLPMIQLEGVSKTFGTGDDSIEAVKPTTMSIGAGDVVGVVGFSGAGKSTLLRLINMLERPTSGTVVVDGKDLTALRNRSLREERQKAGMIFQSFNLLASRTALDNVAFPLEVAGIGAKERRQRSLESLKRVGLDDRADAYPSQLSGGQRQRVGIARALVARPKVLLSDEATSALDPHTTLTILELLRELNEELGITIVVVTHEINVVTYLCDRVAIMERGAVIEDIDLTSGEPQPATNLGKFLFDSAGGWTEESVQLAQNVLGATT